MLRALFELSRQSSSVRIVEIASRAGVLPREAESALLRLERAGLAWSARGRLTLLGLGVAARLPALRAGSMPPASVPGSAKLSSKAEPRASTRAA